jgi:hypothetical protein
MPCVKNVKVMKILCSPISSENNVKLVLLQRNILSMIVIKILHRDKKFGARGGAVG